MVWMLQQPDQHKLNSVKRKFDGIPKLKKNLLSCFSPVESTFYWIFRDILVSRKVYGVEKGRRLPRTLN